MTILLSCGLATIQGRLLYVLQLLTNQIWYPKQTTHNSYTTDTRVYVYFRQRTSAYGSAMWVNHQHVLETTDTFTIVLMMEHVNFNCGQLSQKMTWLFGR